MKLYAEKVGAEFHVIRARKYPAANICFEKFQLLDFLRSNDRVLYLDADVLIRKRAPDIFTEVPVGHFGALDEARHTSYWTEDRIAEQCAPYGWKPPWNGRHFNAGVMVLDSVHQSIFDDLFIENRPFWDQPFFNVMVERKHIRYWSLRPAFNFMVSHPLWTNKERKEEAYFLHFCGMSGDIVGRALAIRREIISDRSEVP